MDQHFPCCWDSSCCLLHPFHVSATAKRVLSCPPMCSGIVSIFLLNSLSPLPPPLHFLLVFELSQEFPLGQSWPPAMFAWLPAHQNGLFSFKWLFLETDQPSQAPLPHLLVESCLSVPWSQNLFFQNSRFLLCYPPTSLLSGSLYHHIYAAKLWSISTGLTPSSGWRSHSWSKVPLLMTCLFVFSKSSPPGLLSWIVCTLPCCPFRRYWRGENPQGEAGPAIKGFSQLITADFIHFQVRCSVAGAHYPVMLIALLSHSDP